MSDLFPSTGSSNSASLFGPLHFVSGAEGADAPVARHRDRHGRGYRALVVPPHLPGYRTRRETFEEMAVEAAQEIATRLGALKIEAGPYTVEIVDVPSEDAPRQAEREGPQLSELVTYADQDPTLTLYRRPIECSVRSRRELGTLLYRIMLSEVAISLAMDPRDIDPLM